MKNDNNDVVVNIGITQRANDDDDDDYMPGTKTQKLVTLVTTKTTVVNKCNNAFSILKVNEGE